MNPTLADVRRALDIADFDTRAAWLKMAPRARPLERPSDKHGQVRLAGVLVLLYPLNSGLAFSLTRRTEMVGDHKGQISLPGGMREGAETLPQTALRETYEEVRVLAEESSIIGRLTPLYLSVSDFEIAPFVAYLDTPPLFDPSPDEVAEMVEMPLPLLLDDSIKAEERWNLRGADIDVPFYRVNGHTVWGATAAILSEFEWRLRAALVHSSDA